MLLLTLSAFPKHRLPPKKRAAVSTVPRRRPDVSSDRVGSVQPRTTSVQASEVAPVPNVTSEASSAVQQSCAFVDVDTPLLSLHSGDTPSNTDGSRNASSACESVPAHSLLLFNDTAADTGNTRQLSIHCASLPIALMSAFEKAPVPSLPLDNVQSGSSEQSWCTQGSLASVHQHFDLDGTAVENAAQTSCLQTSGSFETGVTPCPENGTSTLQNQPECEGEEALSAHLFTIGSSAAETTSLIRRENAELRKKTLT